MPQSKWKLSIISLFLLLGILNIISCTSNGNFILFNTLPPNKYLLANFTIVFRHCSKTCSMVSISSQCLQLTLLCISHFPNYVMFFCIFLLNKYLKFVLAIQSFKWQGQVEWLSSGCLIHITSSYHNVVLFIVLITYHRHWKFYGSAVL